MIALCWLFLLLGWYCSSIDGLSCNFTSVQSEMCTPLNYLTNITNDQVSDLDKAVGVDIDTLGREGLSETGLSCHNQLKRLACLVEFPQCSQDQSELLPICESFFDLVVTNCKDKAVGDPKNILASFLEKNNRAISNNTVCSLPPDMVVDSPTENVPKEDCSMPSLIPVYSQCNDATQQRALTFQIKSSTSCFDQQKIVGLPFVTKCECPATSIRTLSGPCNSQNEADLWTFFDPYTSNTLLCDNTLLNSPPIKTTCTAGNDTAVSGSHIQVIDRFDDKTSLFRRFGMQRQSFVCLDSDSQSFALPSNVTTQCQLDKKGPIWQYMTDVGLELVSMPVDETRVVTLSFTVLSNENASQPFILFSYSSFTNSLPFQYGLRFYGDNQLWMDVNYNTTSTTAVAFPLKVNSTHLLRFELVAKRNRFNQTEQVSPTQERALINAIVLSDAQLVNVGSSNPIPPSTIPVSTPVPSATSPLNHTTPIDPSELVSEDASSIGAPIFIAIAGLFTFGLTWMLYTYIDERRKRAQFTLLNENEARSGPPVQHSPVLNESLQRGGVFRRNKNPDEELEMENFDIYGDSSDEEVSPERGSRFSPVRRTYHDVNE